MKLLLDECIPTDFRHHLPGHEAHTVQYAGFKGKKNGELLQAAERAGYEALITVDQGIPHQVPSRRMISLIVLRSRTNQLEHLKPLVSSLLDTLARIGVGDMLIIESPGI